jgi:hypothetical protein
MRGLVYDTVPSLGIGWPDHKRAFPSQIEDLSARACPKVLFTPTAECPFLIAMNVAYEWFLADNFCWRLCQVISNAAGFFTYHRRKMSSPQWEVKRTRSPYN